MNRKRMAISLSKTVFVFGIVIFFYVVGVSYWQPFWLDKEPTHLIHGIAWLSWLRNDTMGVIAFFLSALSYFVLCLLSNSGMPQVLSGSESKEELKVEDWRAIYDAQLKKTLAYIALGISSLVPQLTMLYLLAGRDPSEKVGLVASIAIGGIAFLLWVSEVAAVFAIVTKFQELVYLESKTTMWKFYDNFKNNRSFLARIWDNLFRRALKVSDEDLRGGKVGLRRLANVLDVAGAIAIAVSVVLLGYIAYFILTLV